jgi:hypothetical protein
VNRALAIALLLAIGVISGFLGAHYSSLRLRETVEPGQLISAIVTLLVVLVLNQIYNRQASTRGVERQLLLEHVGDIRSTLQETYHAFLASPAAAGNLKDAAAKISQAERQFSNAVHSLEVALQYCNVCPGVEFESLKESRFTLKELLTDDPFPLGRYDTARASQIQGAFKMLRDQLTRLLFAINRACH